MEDESRLIGSCKIPDPLFEQMKKAPRKVLTCSKEERVERLLKTYGHHSTGALIEATERIRKRLGGERTRLAIAAIKEGNIKQAIELVLEYYDRTYESF